MRLLLVASEFPPGPGGIATHAYYVARYLSELHGWDVQSIAPQDDTIKSERLAFNSNLPFVLQRVAGRNTLSRGLSYLRQVRAAINAWNPDIILASGQRAVWVSSLLAGDTPLAAVAHGTDLTVGGSIARSITRRAYSRADQVIAVSEATRQRVYKLNIHLPAVTVIPNGADDDLFTMDSTHTSLRPTLLTVGAVKPAKGQDTVIRALPRIREEFPDVVYEIVGTPTHGEAFSTLADELDVSEYVRFRGPLPRERLPEVYQSCDVYVLVSRPIVDDVEGFPISIIEAALCGKPAIVSAGGGAAEAIVDGTTGVAVASDDPVATEQAIIQLLDDKPLRSRMGTAAHERARRDFTWAGLVAEYDAVLREMLT